MAKIKKKLFVFQDFLALLSKAKIRSDFTNGNHGAVKLTKEQVTIPNIRLKTSFFSYTVWI